jgi:lysophospholipase L1-like esterase
MDTSATLQTRKQISRSKKITFAIVASVIALSAIEVTARLITSDQSGYERYRQIQQIVVFLGTQESDMMLDFDAQRFWKLKPNVEVNDPGNHLWQGRVSNSHRVRNDEFEIKKDSEIARVVCFGDSSTFGIGTTMQDAWPAQLETLLNEHPDNPRAQVINSGVPGYTSYQGLMHMRQEIDRLEPDVVIASYANNDFWHWDNKTDREQAARFNRNSFGQLLRKSRAVQVLDQWLTRRDSQNENDDWAKTTSQKYFDDAPAGVARVPLDHFEQNLIAMSEICTERNIRLIYMLWPDQFQAAGRWSKRIDYQDVIKQIANEGDHGIADVVTQFQRNRPWSVRTYFSNDIVHVNKFGNRLAAIAAEKVVLRR